MNTNTTRTCFPFPTTKNAYKHLDTATAKHADIIGKSGEAGGHMKNIMSIVAPSASPEIVSSITSFTAWGILSVATLGYYGVKAVYDPVKNFLENTFSGAKTAVQNSEAVTNNGKPLSDYIVTTLKDSIYKPYILPVLNDVNITFKEVYNLLLIDAIIQDVKDTKDFFCNLYSEILHPFYENHLNSLEYATKFAAIGGTSGTAVAIGGSLVAACFNPAAIASVPVAMAVGGIVGGIMGFTLGVTLDILTNVPAIKTFLEKTFDALPNHLSNTANYTATYSGLLSIIGAAIGTIIAPGAGTTIGGAGGLLLGLVMGLVLGIIEDFIQQSYFDRMTDVEKFALLSKEDQEKYLELSTDEQKKILLKASESSGYESLELADKSACHKLATDEQKELLNSVKGTLKPVDVLGLEDNDKFAFNLASNLGLLGVISSWALPILNWALSLSLAINPAVFVIGKGACLVFGLMIWPLITEICAQLEGRKENAYSYLAKELHKQETSETRKFEETRKIESSAEVARENARKAAQYTSDADLSMEFPREAFV